MKKKIIIGAILAILAIPIAVLAFNLNTFCDGRTDGNYTHPLDETKFIQCENGMAYEMSCPKGTIYNEHAGICVFGEPAPKYSCYEKLATQEGSQVRFCVTCQYEENSTYTTNSKTALCRR